MKERSNRRWRKKEDKRVRESITALKFIFYLLLTHSVS